jgi:hypothetical protein
VEARKAMLETIDSMFPGAAAKPATEQTYAASEQENADNEVPQSRNSRVQVRGKGKTSLIEKVGAFILFMPGFKIKAII